MKVWAHIAKALEAGEPCAMVSVFRVEGSAPREAGARLVLTERGFHGTIGGGALEWRALAEAQKKMKAGRALSVSRHALGPELGQCCGGQVELLTEVFDRTALDEVRKLAAAEAAGTFITEGRLAEDHVERRIVSPASYAAKSSPEVQNAESSSLLPLAGEGGRRPDEGVGQLIMNSAPQEPASGVLAKQLLSLQTSRTPASALSGPFSRKREKGETPERGALVEQFGEAKRPLHLFGAGHVGRALVLAMAPLPFSVRWIDSRPDSFPAAMPANITPILAGNPVAEIKNALPGTFLMVMTHSHALDLAIVEEGLRAGCFPYVGLIGSASKRARFLSRLRQAGIAEERFGAFKCPIGLPGITSKEPAVIAAATVAELLARDEMLRTGRIPGVQVQTPSRIAEKRGQGG